MRNQILIRLVLIWMLHGLAFFSFCLAEKSSSIYYNKTGAIKPDTFFVELNVKLELPDTVNWNDVFIYYPWNIKANQCDFLDGRPLHLAQPNQTPSYRITDKKHYEYKLILDPTKASPGRNACAAINPYGPAGADKWVSSQLMQSVVGGSASVYLLGQTPVRYPVSSNGTALLWEPLKENGCLAKGSWEYMPQCFSAVVFETYTPLAISASVFSQSGNVVWSGKWNYGKCNEFQKSTNYQSQFGWLAWPLIDRNQNFVESGVYIWRVVYSDSKGKQWVQYHRQGVTSLSADQKSLCRSVYTQYGIK